MKYLILILFIVIGLNAQDKHISIMNCLYKEIDIKKVLEDKGLNTKEHIENLLYDDEHKDKYFLKALVLDYYYNSPKAEEYYQMAYQKTQIKEKGLVGLYYALYLQKLNKHEESTRLLRGIDIYQGKGLDVPKKIAYQYEVYGLKKDISIESYFKLKGIMFSEIQGEINECKNN